MTVSDRDSNVLSLRALEEYILFDSALLLVSQDWFIPSTFKLLLNQDYEVEGKQSIFYSK